MCDEEAEYSLTVHLDAIDSGNMRGDVADARDVGGKKVVGEGGPGPGGIEVGDGDSVIT